MEVELKSVDEVATQLQVSSQTLHTWEKLFQLSVKRDSRGRRKYTDENIKMLQTIKLLRDADNGTQTINKKLYGDTREALKEDTAIFVLEQKNASSMELLLSLQETKQELLNKLDGIVELSEKYARATHIMGTLEADNRRLEERIILLDSGYEKDISSLQKDLEKSQAEKTNLEKQNIRLLQENEKFLNELKKPWYKKLF